MVQKQEVTCSDETNAISMLTALNSAARPILLVLTSDVRLPVTTAQ